MSDSNQKQKTKTKTKNCSQFVVEAIQIHNWMRLLALLSPRATSLMDTYWAAAPQYFTSLYGLTMVEFISSANLERTQLT